MAGITRGNRFTKVNGVSPCDLPFEALAYAQANLEAWTPQYTYPLAVDDGVGGITIVNENLVSTINLWIVCGAEGVLEFSLLKDGSNVLTTLNVVKGQKVEGHFMTIGANTSVPVVGFGNLP